MTRVHEPSIEVLAKQDGDRWVLRSPGPGWFLPAASLSLVTQGSTIGELDVLGRRTRLVAPAVHGLASAEQLVPRTVGFGDVLLVLETATVASAVRESVAAAADRGATGAALVFRAPTSGRFYSRATPDKPVFVSVGDELGAGTTVCLLEVMKTFNRVTYGGANLPERARVSAVLVADGADVTAGDPLLALEPA